MYPLSHISIETLIINLSFLPLYLRWPDSYFLIQNTLYSKMKYLDFTHCCLLQLSN